MLSFFTDTLAESYIHLKLGNEQQENKCNYLASNQHDAVCVNRNEVPMKNSGTIRVIIISDTHERHDCVGNLHLPDEADILIHCGDILMTNSRISHQLGLKKLQQFEKWIKSSSIIPTNTHKLIVAGNHDHVIHKLGSENVQQLINDDFTHYLENEGKHLMIPVPSINNNRKLHVFGTPVSRGASYNSAFQSKRCHKHMKQQLYEYITAIETEKQMNGNIVSDEPPLDIFISHGPNLTLMEEYYMKHNKCLSKLHVWGHGHGVYGIRKYNDTLWTHCVSTNLSVNASIMDTSYCPTNYPIVIDIS